MPMSGYMRYQSLSPYIKLKVNCWFPALTSGIIDSIVIANNVPKILNCCFLGLN
jgi:hypothetical protein